MQTPERVRHYLRITAYWLALVCSVVLAEPRKQDHNATPEALFRELGPYTVEPTSGSMSGAFGCQIHYEHYQPAAADSPVRVILTHGFMRKLKHMRGWGQHWSSWGLPTTLVSLCNSNLLNGHHQRNADDLAHLATRLYPARPVIFAGFSAGGLAAWLAANDTPAAVAYLGLDPVDSGKLAQRAIHRRPLPGLVLYARGSMCNAGNNFLSSAERQPTFQLLGVAGASHCHFELPFDRRCTWVCGGATAERSDENIQNELLGTTTRWLLSIVEN